MADPIQKYISKAEFARLIDVHPSQVTRALQRGRIHATRTGRIDWKQARIDWEAGRTDTLKGRGGRANNKPLLKGLPDVGDVPDVEDVDGDLDEDDIDKPVTAPKVSRTDRLSVAVLKEAEAKAERQHMRAQKEAGQLFERQDIMASFGAILNALKSAVLSWPQRTAKSMIGLVQQWLKEEGIDIDPIKLAPLETRILNIAAKESNHVLKAIARNDKGKEAELDKIVEKNS